MGIANLIDESTKALQKGDIEVGFGDAQLQNRSERLTSPGLNAIHPNGIPIRIQTWCILQLVMISSHHRMPCLLQVFFLYHV